MGKNKGTDEGADVDVDVDVGVGVDVDPLPLARPAWRGRLICKTIFLKLKRKKKLNSDLHASMG